MRNLPPLFAAKLAEREASSTLRRLSDKTAQIDFCSNDYLGLAKKVTQSAGHILPTGGSTGSRLISGNQSYLTEFEKAFCAQLGYEQGLVYATGYSANLGLLSALSQRGVIFIMDELCHASLIDGARMGFAKRQRFRHNDCFDLERQLAVSAEKSAQLVVVIESVYSMDGDIAPLEAIIKICEQYDAALVVDEAHAFGVLGHFGQGLVCQLGLQSEVLSAVYTFGKAPGAHGAVIAGSELLCQYLVNFSRPFIYSTAPSKAQISEMFIAFEQLTKEDEARQKLMSNIAYFKQQSKLCGIETIDSDTPIQAIIVGDIDKAYALADWLNESGFWVKPIVAPTVAQGTERIRICLHSFNEFDEIEAMLQKVSQFMEGK